MTEHEMLTIHRDLTRSYGEDVAQEALCRLFAVSTPIDHPEHWLRRTARRLFVDEYRHRTRLVLTVPETWDPPSQVEWARCSEAYDQAPQKVEACLLENRPSSTVRRYRLELRRMG